MIIRILCCLSLLAALTSCQGEPAAEKTRVPAETLVASCAKENGTEIGRGKTITSQQATKITACLNKRTEKLRY